MHVYVQARVTTHVCLYCTGHVAFLCAQSCAGVLGKQDMSVCMREDLRVDFDDGAAPAQGWIQTHTQHMYVCVYVDGWLDGYCYVHA